MDTSLLWTWSQFIISLGLLMYLARKSLWLALATSSLVLGFMALTPMNLSVVVFDTLTDASIVLLSISVGLIAMIGGAMDKTGLMRDLVDNTRLRKKGALMVIPGILGMLPIPGGALLSAPIVDRAGKGISRDVKASVNIWSRHLAVLVYPLGSLLATTKMAGINLYIAILAQIPFFILTLILTYFLILRNTENNRVGKDDPELKRSLIPLACILTAPAIHLAGIMIFPSMLEEIFLISGVILSLGLVTLIRKMTAGNLKSVFFKMKAYNFALIILFMFVFLNVFHSSAAPGAISSLPLTLPLMVVMAGGFLGVATGRVNVPISIMVPILIAGWGDNIIDLACFSILFFSVFVGFLISPVHPCVSVSMEYFRTDYPSVLKRTIIPAIIAWMISMIAAFVLL